MAISEQELGRERGLQIPPSLADELNADVPELQWPDSIDVYRQMLRSDGQIAGVAKAVRLPIQATPWMIDPGPASDEVALFVGRNLGVPVVGQPVEATRPIRLRGRFTWGQHMRDAVRALFYGHMVFEQVYDPERLQATGEAVIRKLAPRWPWTLKHFEVADDGGLRWIEQYGRDYKPIRLTVDRLVVYVNEPEGGSWLGMSILRPAYKHWMLVDRAYRIVSITGERASGHPQYEASENAGKAEMDFGQALAEDMRLGERSGVAVPHGARLVWQGIQGSTYDLMPWVEHHNAQKAISVLQLFMQLKTGELGSRALGETFIDFYILALQAVLEEFQRTAQQHVIEDLVDVNFGTAVPAPLIVPGDVAGQPRAIAAGVVELIRVGAITPDEELESFLRSAYRLPQATAGEE